MAHETPLDEVHARTVDPEGAVEIEGVNETSSSADFHLASFVTASAVNESATHVPPACDTTSTDDHGWDDVMKRLARVDRRLDPFVDNGDARRSQESQDFHHHVPAVEKKTDDERVGSTYIARITSIMNESLTESSHNESTLHANRDEVISMVRAFYEERVAKSWRLKQVERNTDAKPAVLTRQSHLVPTDSVAELRRMLEAF